MPSSWPITKSGCGVGPLYSSTTAIGRLPFHATPQRVRLNSRSSRSHSAYAAYSRSPSRIERRSALSVVAAATIAPRRPMTTVAIRWTPEAWAWSGRSVAAAVASAGGVGSFAALASAWKPGIEAQRACADSVAARSPSAYGARTTPSSVTKPVMSSAGVTSKAGFRTSVPGGAIRTPRNSVTSSWWRSSIGMSVPSAVARSTDVVGATT